MTYSGLIPSFSTEGAHVCRGSKAPKLLRHSLSRHPQNYFIPLLHTRSHNQGAMHLVVSNPSVSKITVPGSIWNNSILCKNAKVRIALSAIGVHKRCDIVAGFAKHIRTCAFIAIVQTVKGGIARIVCRAGANLRSSLMFIFERRM
jgi:hypothetical protein